MLPTLSTTNPTRHTYLNECTHMWMPISAVQGVTGDHQGDTRSIVWHQTAAESEAPVIPVNVDNYVEAETAAMFDNQLAMTGGVNRWVHYRVPTPVDQQPVIRMNRDTLYSAAVVDISEGGTVTLPEANGRYMTLMVINEKHTINRVFDEPGTYELSIEEHGTPFVNAVVRTLIDANDPADIAAVNALQDQLVLNVNSSTPYAHPDYDAETLAATKDALLALGGGVPDTKGMFGSPSETEPIRHLIGTATGWGGLPETEAFYYMETDPRPAGRYTLTFKDVPVDAFWSVSIYNREGFYEANPYGAHNLNSVTAEADPDGSVILNLASEGERVRNHLYISDGWNYAIRLYKPRQAVLDRSWMPPTPEPIE